MLPILTAEKMLTQNKLKELVAQHGRVAHLTQLRSFSLRTTLYPLDDDESPPEPPKSAFFELVLRPATPAELKVFKTRMKTAAAATAEDELLKQMTVHPESPEVLKQIMTEWAGLSSGASKTILRLSAAAVEEEGKG